MAVVGKMQQLRVFGFDASGVSDRGVAQLDHIDGLEELHLQGPCIDDAFLRRISRLHNLTGLVFNQTNVSDAGLTAIEDLVKLEVLYLPADTTDAGFQHLEKLTKLRCLKPVDKITDRGLAFLRNMTEIEELDLFEPSSTDEGLEYLQRMKNLQTLRLCGN